MSNQSTQWASEGEGVENGITESDTNFGMKSAVSRELEAANAKLSRVLYHLEACSTAEETVLLRNAQVHWEGYRQAIQEYAREHFKGHSHAALEAAQVALHETDRRAIELESQLAARLTE